MHTLVGLPAAGARLNHRIALTSWSHCMKAAMFLIFILSVFVLITGCTVSSDGAAASIDRIDQPTLLYFFTKG
ncbi:MAG: hypothetical protein IT320_22700 [Anaerolineae bacterium]|nr:hypothetical protein [Anaerolineae bacterium]